MRMLYVPLSLDDLQKLTDLARRERRETRQQAAYLLERALLQTLREEPVETRQQNIVKDEQPGV